MSDSNWQHFAITQVLDWDKKIFFPVLLHRLWPECQPKRVPDSSPCVLERQQAKDGVRLPLLIIGSLQN